MIIFFIFSVTFDKMHPFAAFDNWDPLLIITFLFYYELHPVDLERKCKFTAPY